MSAFCGSVYRSGGQPMQPRNEKRGLRFVPSSHGNFQNLDICLGLPALLPHHFQHPGDRFTPASKPVVAAPLPLSVDRPRFAVHVIHQQILA